MTSADIATKAAQDLIYAIKTPTAVLPFTTNSKKIEAIQQLAEIYNTIITPESESTPPQRVGETEVRRSQRVKKISIRTQSKIQHRANTVVDQTIGESLKYKKTHRQQRYLSHMESLMRK